MSRPDCKVEATFYVHDVPGTITDSAAPLLHDALTRFIKEELEGFGINVEYTPVPTLEDLDRLLEKAEASDYIRMETSHLIKALEQGLAVMNTREGLRRVIAICRVLAARPLPERR